MENLIIMSQPAAPHVNFGWFNLAWPNIAFWVAAILVFVLSAWARIPLFMEADVDSRRKEVDQ